MHRVRWISVAAAGSALLCLGRAAEAQELIGRYVVDRDWGVFDVVTQVEHTTWLAPNIDAAFGEGTLFEGIVLTSGQMRLDVATADTDPDFARFAELITDGQDWFLFDDNRFVPGVAGSGIRLSGLESMRLPVETDGMLFPDLQGWTITRVERTMRVTLISPGSNPNGDGNWTDIRLRTQVDIYGVIPAPGPVVTVAIASVLARRSRRR